MASASKNEQQEFHAERSKLLDAYVRVEEAIGALLAKAKIEVNGEMLGQRIELLKKAKAAPQYSKEKRKQVLELLPEFEDYLAIRADIAHGRLQIVRLDDEPHACFVNARHCANNTHIARLVSRSQFERLNKRLRSLADRLDSKS